MDAVECVAQLVLTGFPWLALGYTAIEDPLSGFAPVGGGVYAVNACLGRDGRTAVVGCAQSCALERRSLLGLL